MRSCLVTAALRGMTVGARLMRLWKSVGVRRDKEKGVLERGC